MSTTPTELTFTKSLDEYMSSLSTGSLQRAISNNLYGINFRQTPNAVPRSKTQQGFVFFTRPQLNLTTSNITNEPSFYSLLNQNRLSYQRYVRCMLDPRLGIPSEPDSQGITTPLVDKYMPFIPLLTNNISSLSGWPDISVPYHTSEPGLYGQEFSMVDGVTNHFEAFDLDVTFSNMRGNPIIYMFYVWLKYSTLVVEGVLNPYFDFVSEVEIDSNTRIYRVILDQTKRYVEYIGCTGASFPTTVPTGAIFDFNKEKPLNTQITDINIRFRSMGFVAFDDIVKFWFNQAVAIFNASLRAQLEMDLTGNSNNDAILREDPRKVYLTPDSAYMRVPHALVVAADDGSETVNSYTVNHRGVPYINLYTSEMEWWVPTNDFQAMLRRAFPEDIISQGPGNADEEVGD